MSQTVVFDAECYGAICGTGTRDEDAALAVTGGVCNQPFSKSNRCGNPDFSNRIRKECRSNLQKEARVG
jgi:hypothetical protein